MEPYENHLSLATAIAVGLLIGLEREQTKQDRGSTLAGVRTYPIFALVGGLATLLESASMWLPLVALAGVIALVALSYAADLRRDNHDDHGVTTEASVIATYLLGALATSRGVVEPMADRLVLVAGLGVAITFLLSSKQFFHNFAARVSRDDLFATVKFLIVAVIVLPMLPDRDLGPLGAINPRHLGLLVVMISGLSFIGYVAMRLLGARRGLLLGAALGALVSSTAVTLSFATRTKAEPKLAPVAAGAIAVAWTIMLIRVGVLVALVDLALLRTLAMPLGAMIVAALLGLLLTFRRTNGDEGEITLQNPFELGSAIKVTLVFAVVLLATKAATVYLGSQGLYLASALGGTTDVDAVTLSTARLSHGATVSALVATVAIVIAIAVNTVVKLGLALGIGGAGLGKRVALVAALVIIAAGVTLALAAGFA
ncbi:MAG TPA: MgtC/SapB family protein [Kofleriaceae bacterium]|nr:MgtC/SapB family protein [Kofleriaceae bacterium]